ncbi:MULTISPECIES: AAA family ATPase [Candidatus Nitrosocaldus]|jgi:magnesium chelatase subunit I|uniref:Putative Mg-chelatase subunit n=1 Tax=Candidatus Nitrosocaldus cavascurensis TaxID=2058097 RepID=A0A2K5APC9_9ARCH|nr:MULTISPECIES: AAA family ATPase [Candidatus Nitrosocaldus]SPC33508.1 putative Mg-chelatase subunit [Candidatus Nitrosocaldus cavascurensis]
MDSERIRELVYKSYSSKPSYVEVMPGVPEDYKRIETLGQLLEVNYKYISVDEQMRRNLIEKRRSMKNPYPGIIGYDDVIAATDRAILAGHDILYIGKIGQAKTKLAETIARNLLSPIPAVKGCIIHDIPTLLPADELARLLAGYEPEHMTLEFHICNECEYRIRDDGLDTRIEWIDGMSRYRYVLATPDISIKDLVGQIDAAKIAKGATLYSIASYSPGQLLQARHGILCIDELPVLDPRKQVVLLSVLQEGKFTTGSYPVIFKPYVRVIATANPVDYTHASKIIEPLVDRFESHIVTHYPYTIRDEMAIMVQEAKVDHSYSSVVLPIFMLKMIARITHLAREHPDVNKEKGVSVRMSIHALELLISEAMRVRALYNDGVAAVPRPSDMHAIVPAAKFELSELEDSSENRRRVLEQIMDESLKQTSLEYVMDLTQEQLASIREEFKGRSITVAQTTLWGDGNSRRDGGIHNNHDEVYSIQLAKFRVLPALIDSIMLKVEREHVEFMEYLRRHGIDTRLLEIGEGGSSNSSGSDSVGEIKASIFELVLEGLRHMRPPVLDRREKGVYVAT